MSETPDEQPNDEAAAADGDAAERDTSSAPDLDRPATEGDSVKSTELTSGDHSAAETAAPKPQPTPAAAAAAAPPKGPHDPVVAAHHDTLAVAIAKTRKRPPFWATLALVALPVWGLLYLNAMTKPGAGANDPLVLGGNLYQTNCSSCHGGSGEGISGPKLNGGAVVKTWPDYKAQIQWVTLGSEKYQEAGHTTFGDGKTAIDPSKQMPAFGGTLSDQEIAQIVYFERVQFGNEAPNEDLAALATGEGTGG